VKDTTKFAEFKKRRKKQPRSNNQKNRKKNQMKMTKMLTLAVGVALALIGSRAMATSSSNILSKAIFNFSATADFVKTNYMKGTNQIATTTTVSYKEKDIYFLISNAVANASTYSTNVPVATLPADGYIVYDSYDYDGGPETGNGYFYVTNSSGFYYQLSGLGTNGQYYSFMELDGQIPYNMSGDNVYLGTGLAYSSGFFVVTNFDYDEKTKTGPESVTESAVLYIHNDPLSYDAPSSATKYTANVTAIQVPCTLKISVSFKGGSQVANVERGSISLSGDTGVAIAAGGHDGVITSAKATFTP
jgi:hypothetical protein